MTSMKQILLATLIATGLTLPVQAGEQPNVATTMDHPTHFMSVTNPKDLPATQITVMKPEHQSPAKVTSKDRVRVTIHCEFDLTSDEFDHNPMLFIEDNKGNYWNYEGDDLFGNKGNDDLVVNLPKGTYHGVLVTQTNRPEKNGMLKFVFVNETEITEATTLVFDANTATHRISFEYSLSNGEKARVLDYSEEGPCYRDFNSGNCQANAYRLLRSKQNAEVGIQIFDMLIANSPFYVGEDIIKANDFFVNIPTPHYDMFTAMYISPTDPLISSWSQTLPKCLTSRTVNLEKDIDHVYTQKASDLDKFNFPSFKKSLCKDQPNVYTNVLGDEYLTFGSICASFMTNNGYFNYSLIGDFFTDHIMLDLDNTSPVMLSIMSNESSKSDYYTDFYDDEAGIVTPKFYATEGGSAYYIMNDNMAYRYPYDMVLRTSWQPANSFIYNEFYSFSTKDQIPDFGNSAPFFSYTPAPSYPDSDTAYQYYLDMTLPSYIGNFGERRTIDKLLMDFKVKANDEVIIDDFEEYPWLMYDYATPERDPQQITMTFDNKNFEIDGIQGRTYAEVKYMEKKDGDFCAPSLQMMQFRNEEGKITNRFEKAEESTVYLSYGDFVFDFIQRNFSIDDCDIKFEVAPNGTDNFIEIATEEEPDQFMDICWGHFRSGKLIGLGKSANGWWDVRVTLTDAAGNSTFQHISPAFYASNTDVSGVEAAISETGFFVNGNTITSADGNNAAFTIYTLNGAHIADVNAASINLGSYGNGLYIVKAINSNGSRTFKMTVK